MNSTTRLSTSTKNSQAGSGQSTALDWLRQVFPHGHPEFLPILLNLAQLHSDKNHDYTSGGNPLGNFDRVGKIRALYPNIDWSQPDAVAVSYMMKQLDAALWGMNSHIQAKVEGAFSRWQDVAVYAMIILCILKERANEDTKSNTRSATRRCTRRSR